MGGEETWENVHVRIVYDREMQAKEYEFNYLMHFIITFLNLNVIYKIFLETDIYLFIQVNLIQIIKLLLSNLKIAVIILKI